MAQQWRVECQSCGTPNADYLRMHTQLTREEIRDLEDDNTALYETYVEQGGTIVECNVCGTRRHVTTS